MDIILHFLDHEILDLYGVTSRYDSETIRLECRRALRFGYLISQGRLLLPISSYFESDVAREVVAEQGADLSVLCASLEEDMAGLTDAERLEYLELSGVAESGLDQVMRQGYVLLGLISYFSFNKEEVRAWTIRKGWTAPQAAGVIHTDFERGFIRAEVCPYATFIAHGNWAALRAEGLSRVEGRDYVVQDGDVVHFRFNV